MNTAIWLILAVLWPLAPAVCMFILGERYTKRWDHLEKHLVDYFDHCLHEHLTGTTRPLPRVEHAPGRGVGAARLPDEEAIRIGRHRC